MNVHDLKCRRCLCGLTKKRARQGNNAPKNASFRITTSFETDRSSLCKRASDQIINTRFSFFCPSGERHQIAQISSTPWLKPKNFGTRRKLRTLRGFSVLGLLSNIVTVELGTQYLSIRHSERLIDVGVKPSVSTTGDSYRPSGDDHRALQDGSHSSARSLPAHRRRSSTRPWNGWTVSITAGCWSPSATCRPQNSKWRIIANVKSWPWWLDSTEIVSGKTRGDSQQSRTKRFGMGQSTHLPH